MDWGAGVAARLTLLSLTPGGRPVVQLLAADGIRCGLIVDLSIAGNLEAKSDYLDIDPSSTGFPPADVLLRAITVEPERSLESWFGDRRLSLQMFIDSLVSIKVLSERKTLMGRRKYAAADGTLRDDKSRDSADCNLSLSTEDAAVSALGCTAHLINPYRKLSYASTQPEVSPCLLERTGDNRWAVEAGVEFLRNRRGQYLTGGNSLSQGPAQP